MRPLDTPGKVLVGLAHVHELRTLAHQRGHLLGLPLAARVISFACHPRKVSAEPAQAPAAAARYRNGVPPSVCPCLGSPARLPAGTL